MKQVLQNISNGETIIENVPAPKNKKSNLLISTSKTYSQQEQREC